MPDDNPPDAERERLQQELAALQEQLAKHQEEMRTTLAHLEEGTVTVRRDKADHVLAVRFAD